MVHRYRFILYTARSSFCRCCSASASSPSCWCARFPAIRPACCSAPNRRPRRSPASARSSVSMSRCGCNISTSSRISSRARWAPRSSTAPMCCGLIGERIGPTSVPGARQRASRRSPSPCRLPHSRRATAAAAVDHAIRLLSTAGLGLSAVLARHHADHRVQREARSVPGLGLWRQPRSTGCTTWSCPASRWRWRSPRC